MHQRERERYRARLETLVARLQPDIEAVTESTRRPSGGQSAGELSNAPMHLGDMGTDEYLHDLNATLLTNEEHLTEEVRAALRRIHDGTFGRCEQCGEWIPEARLKAIPYARHCVQCAEVEDTALPANLNTGRPRTPSETLAPEGKMREDRLRRAQAAPPTDGEPQVRMPEQPDVHAAGTAGGGTAVGGLAGTTTGHGDPDIAVVDDATGSGNYDAREARPTVSSGSRGSRASRG
jgi:DnaK suppressor protein